MTADESSESNRGLLTAREVCQVLREVVFEAVRWLRLARRRGTRSMPATS